MIFKGNTKGTDELIEGLLGCYDISNFENVCGLDEGIINNMTEYSIFGFNNVANIVESFQHLNAEWILTGKGSMIKDNVDKDSIKMGKDFKYS